jgi:acyl-CoA thioester hydrolase
MRSKTGRYFARIPGTPAPLTLHERRRVSFSEVDVLGIAWHGRYLEYFEAGATELRRRCGLSFQAFYAAHLRAPVVHARIDYFRPLQLDEEFDIRTLLLWNEAARLDMEYAVLKGDGTPAATGCTVQLFVDARTDETCVAAPDLWLRCRERWLKGEFQWPA